MIDAILFLFWLLTSLGWIMAMAAAFLLMFGGGVDKDE